MKGFGWGKILQGVFYYGDVLYIKIIMNPCLAVYIYIYILIILLDINYIDF